MKPKVLCIIPIDYLPEVREKLEQNTTLIVEPFPAKERLLRLHRRVAAYLIRVDENMKDENQDHLAWAITEGAAIGDLMKETRREHLARLQKEEVSPYFSLAYTDMLNFYRRMKDHALNIAEVVVGEK